MRGIGRCLIIAISICSWISISNHCALAVIPSRAAIVQSACPFHSHHASNRDGKKKTAAQPCCKILRATVAIPVKTPALAILHMSGVDPGFGELVIFTPAKVLIRLDALDTGPPGAFSFAELILQRSLFSHAPPFVV